MSIFDDMDSLAQVQAHLAHWRDQLADGRREDDFLFRVQANGIIATLEQKEAELQAAKPAGCAATVDISHAVWSHAAVEGLKRLQGSNEPDVAHQDADGILCNLLVKLGFADVVEVWVEVPKWYA